MHLCNSISRALARQTTPLYKMLPLLSIPTPSPIATISSLARASQFLSPSMASFLQFLLLFSLSLHLVFASADDQSSVTNNPIRPCPPILRPSTLVLRVHKDCATNLHVAQILKRTPPVQLPFVVDLNGQFLSVNCDDRYLSSTFNAPICHSTQCSRANTHTCRTCTPRTPSYPMARPGCHVNACAVTAVNPVTQKSATCELAEDVLSIPSALGSMPGPMFRVPQFLFACEPSTLLQRGLPQNVQGIAGFGHSRISLPVQLASYFGISPKIAICLASGSRQNGVIFFGEGPYMMLPGIDLSRQLTDTALSIGQQGEYLINVQSIQINSNCVPLPPKFRSNVPCMLSTTTPYTILHQSIFTVLTQLYIKQLPGVPPVTAVPPFGLCFNANNISHSRMGPAVPSIHLVLDSRQNLRWTIFGPNAMVQARPGVMCLAVVNGGPNPKTPIVIGAHQMEDNLVQLDLVNSRVGLSNSLLFRRTNCGNFNFNLNTNTTTIP